MSSTRENTQRNTLRDATRAAIGATILTGGMLLAVNALAEQVSIQFSQTYPGGGTVTGLLVGEDLDGDGRLYSMNPFIGDELGQPPGDEVTYASVRIEGVLGEPVSNVFDDSVGDGIDDQANANFFGFAYNLDGGPLGDAENEGVSFAPLAPSTSYVAGALFEPAVSPSVIPDPIRVCGNPDGFACSAIITLEPAEPAPNFELLFDATSAEPIVTTELLRYTFEQWFRRWRVDHGYRQRARSRRRRGSIQQARRWPANSAFRSVMRSSLPKWISSAWSPRLSQCAGLECRSHRQLRRILLLCQRQRGGR